MKTVLYRWCGYALLVFVLVNFGMGGLQELGKYYDLPTILIMLAGMAAAAMICLGPEIWPALRVWNLRDDADPCSVSALECLCGVMGTGNWLANGFNLALAAVIILQGGVNDPHMIRFGLGLALLPLVYAPIMALWLHAHRVRARRWLERHTGVGK